MCRGNRHNIVVVLSSSDTPPREAVGFVLCVRPPFRHRKGTDSLRSRVNTCPATTVARFWRLRGPLGACCAVIVSFLAYAACGICRGPVCALVWAQGLKRPWCLQLAHADGSLLCVCVSVPPTVFASRRHILCFRTSTNQPWLLLLCPLTCSMAGSTSCTTANLCPRQT